MSSIASKCGIALSSLEAQNTQITNAALLQVGEQVRIHKLNEFIQLKPNFARLHGLP